MSALNQMSCKDVVNATQSILGGCLVFWLKISVLGERKPYSFPIPCEYKYVTHFLIQLILIYIVNSRKYLQ